MSQSELARAVNRVVGAQTGRAGKLTVHMLKRYERGAIRWPSKRYRDALRVVLHVASDAELGFFPIPRGVSTRELLHEGRTREPRQAVDSLGADRVRSVGLSTGDPGYVLFVRAIIRDGDQLLLVRSPETEGSLLPGGRVVPGLPVHGVLVDYVAEQARISVKVGGFAGGVLHPLEEPDGGRYAITLVFEASLIRSQPPAEGDATTRGPLWLPAEDLDDHDLRPTAIKTALIDGADGPFWRTWTP